MRTYRSHINLAIAVVSFALTTNVAQAQTTYTWNNGTTDFEASGSWTASGPDWTSDTRLADSIAVFGTRASGSAQPLIGENHLYARGISFDSSGSGSQWELSSSGGSLTLGSSGITTTGISGMTTITADLVLAAGQTWNVASGTTLSFANLNRTIGGTVAFSGGGAITNNSISNSNGILGGYAVIGNDWAARDGTVNIVALPSGSYVNTTDPNTWTAENNVKIDGAIGFLSAGSQDLFANSLNFTTNDTLSIDSTLAISSGGILASTNATISGGFITTPNVDLIVHVNGSTNTLTISSGIGAASDSIGLTKAGSGTLILSGESTYTGGTIISAGTLQLGDGVTNGSISGNITNNSTLSFNLKENVTFEGVISGSGSVTVTGSHTLEFSGNNTYTGVTSIGSGSILEIGTSGSIVGNVTNNGLLSFFSGNDISYAGNITGSGDIDQNGSGSLTLIGNSTAGIVRLTSRGSLFVTGNLEVTNSFSHTGDSRPIGGILGGSGTITITTSTPLFVQENSAIRGGTRGTTDILEVAGNLKLGASGAGLGDAILQVEASRTGEGTANASKISVTGATNELNLYTGIVIDIVNGATPLQPLQVGETYTITLASVETAWKIKFDGATFEEVTVIDPSKYTIRGSDFTPTGTSLSINGTNLVLTFTVSPVPEPGAVLGIAVGALALGGLVRRQLRKPVAVSTTAAL